MPRLARKSPTSRLTLEMAVQVRKELEHLRDKTNADSLAEVIRRALAVYDTLWTEKARGNRIILRAGKEERELLLT